MQRATRFFPVLCASFLVASVLLLQACANGDKPRPTTLEPVPASLNVKEQWRFNLGPTGLPLEAHVVGSQVLLASSQGEIAALEARSGKVLWHAMLAEALSAGVGGDGDTAAVVTRENQLVALRAGQELWRQKMPSLTLTPPLVAGGRIFLQSADRTISAFDASTGRKLWVQKRPGDALVLGKAGILMAVGDTLVSGQSGRLLGLNPLTGATRWDAAVAVGRGVNEVERLVDMVSGVSRAGDTLCVRAFQTAVACVDAQLGRTVWTKTAAGSSGITGNRSTIFGAESDDKVVSWRRADGEKLWTSEKLRFRGLSSPVLFAGSVVVGDFEGYLHFLSAQDGALISRVMTDGSAIALTPVLADETLVAVSSRGTVIGFGLTN